MCPHSEPKHRMLFSGQLHAPAAFPPALFEYEAGWAPETVITIWRRGKPLASVRNQTKFLGLSSPWPCHYIDYNLSASKEIISKK